MAYINAYGMHKRNITYKKYTTNKICNECIRKIYQQYFENPIPENMPNLEDLYDALLSHGNKKAERIANSLVLYVHGSQNYFNHRTNVNSQNRIICFDIRDLSNLVDNAIEACEKVEPERRYINLIIKVVEENLFIHIENSKISAPVDINVSTKDNPDSHGIGVARVKERLYETDKCRLLYTRTSFQ